MTDTVPRRTLREKLVDTANRVGERFIRWLDGYFGRHSLVGDHTFFDPADFSWVAEIEAGVPAIRAELDEVLRYRDELPNFQDISTDQYQITDDDRWKTFFFYGYGFTAGNNVERCPETARLVQRIPGMTTAMFSILAPHKRIPAHGGPYKGVLRYHLALMVPEPPGAVRDPCRQRRAPLGPRARASCSTTSSSTRPGTTPTARRVVLFVDFKRPLAGLPRIVNETIIKVIGWSPFIQDAKARHNAWEKRFEQVRERACLVRRQLVVVGEDLGERVGGLFEQARLVVDHQAQADQAHLLGDRRRDHGVDEDPLVEQVERQEHRRDLVEAPEWDRHDRALGRVGRDTALVEHREERRDVGAQTCGAVGLRAAGSATPRARPRRFPACSKR